MAAYVEKLIRRYLSTRESASETFAVWAHRVDDDVLQHQWEGRSA
ncbi:hypothetical protein [Nesterenkonia pannonica]|nr:hypothetical protein [Nesterenkonia pannonica]